MRRRVVSRSDGALPGPSSRPHRRRLAAAVCTILACTGATAAHAQETVLVAPFDGPDYDRGRNVSVLERPRPDYDALGIRRGAFLIYPRLGVQIGATDNVYLTDGNKTADIYAALTPSVLVRSDWSIHQLMLAGGAAIRRYADETPRNQDEWYLNALGRADIGGNLSVTAEAQASRTQESPFTGAVQTDVAALSSYDRRTVGLRAQYTTGQTRVTLAYDLNDFDFDDVVFASGTRVSQRDRDRQINRVTGQVEYALSPSFSVYGQISYADTDYDRLLRTGAANRDSHALRIIGGVNFDLSAFMRGSIGAGYVDRTYRSALYKDVSGPSVEARIEYFPTQLTTATLFLRRVIDDSNISGTGAFFDNLASLRIDHELRGNILLNVEAAYAQQDYIGSPVTSDIFRANAGGRYLISRDLQLQATIGYASRSDNQAGGLGTVSEVSALFGIILQR